MMIHLKALNIKTHLNMKTLIKKKLFVPLLFGTLISITLQCSVGETAKERTNTSILNSADSIKESVSTDIVDSDNVNADTIFYGIPAPEETISYIAEGQLTFNPKILNPVSNQNKYIDSRLKTINLGVYFADVAYTTVFSQPNYSSEYIKVIEEIGVEISVFSEADKDIRKRMSENYSNVDSLSSISQEAYEIIVHYLISSNRQKTYALLCIGSYLESIYIALNYSDKYTDFSPQMRNRIIEQKLLFNDIYTLMISLKNDPDIARTILELSTIKIAFDKIEYFVQNITTTENEQKNLVVNSENQYTYNEGDFTAFKNAITTLRNEWTRNDN